MLGGTGNRTLFMIAAEWRGMQHIPDVALTGHALAGISEGAKKAGCDAFVTKPCLPEDLVKEIRKVLDQTGYRRMLKISNDPEDQERLANIEELITAAKQFAASDDTGSGAARSTASAESLVKVASPHSSGG